MLAIYSMLGTDTVLYTSLADFSEIIRLLLMIDLRINCSSSISLCFFSSISLCFSYLISLYLSNSLVMIGCKPNFEGMLVIVPVFKAYSRVCLVYARSQIKGETQAIIKVFELYSRESCINSVRGCNS